MASTSPRPATSPSIPDFHPDLLPVRVNGAARRVDGSVSLLVDDDAVRVVLHGSIGHHLHQDIRDLVDDLVSDAAATARRPVRVVARDVREFGLQGVWLLLELRRAARPAAVTLVEPSHAVCLALRLHGLASLLPTPTSSQDAAAAR